MEEGRAIKCVAVMFVTVVVLATMIGCGFFDKGKRENCAVNLKQLGTALKLYASSYNDKYPIASGAEGLEILRANDFLADYNVYICPTTSNKAGSGYEALTYGSNSQAANVTYAFVGGMIDGDSSLWGRADSAIAADFSGNPAYAGINGGKSNHEKFGNILFLDGSVRDFSGANWFNTTNTGYVDKNTVMAFDTFPMVPNRIVVGNK